MGGEWAVAMTVHVNNCVGPRTDGRQRALAASRADPWRVSLNALRTGRHGERTK